MKLSKKLAVGIEAVAILKRNDGSARTVDMAKEMRTTVNLLQQIMRKLRKADIVHVKHGSGGGYTLNEETPVTVYMVARAIGDLPEKIKDGDMSPNAKLRQAIIDSMVRIKI